MGDGEGGSHSPLSVQPGPVALRNSKNIVLCADGTGNSGGKGYGTNVWRLFSAVDLHGHEVDETVPRQLAFYDDGVGTEDFKLLKVLGGAFGLGLSRKIRDLYDCLARNYAPGDAIFVFGFSRGAFTARSLTGLIAACGIVDLDRELSKQDVIEIHRDACRLLWVGRLLAWLGFFTPKVASIKPASSPLLARKMVRAAFNTYRRQHRQDKLWVPKSIARRTPGLRGHYARKIRDRKQRAAGKHVGDVTLAEQFRQRYGVKVTDPELGTKTTCVPIRCVGVWDTVGALGAPIDLIRTLFEWLFSFDFHRQDLHGSVQHGFHALSIDDERRTFHPILWNERESHTPGRIEQVWFAGVHSNVGGGYPKPGMATVSLYWMMRRAEACGLRFQVDEIDRARRQRNVHDKLYDSRASLASYYRYAPRTIAELADEFCIGSPKIHHSVFDRVASGIQDYVPFNLPESAAVVGDEVSWYTSPADAADKGTTQHWSVRVREALTLERQRQLSKHRKDVMRWVGRRVALYYVMLTGSLAIALGTAVLRWSKPAAANAQAIHTPPIEGTISVLASMRGGLRAANKSLWQFLTELTPQPILDTLGASIRMTRWLVEALVPDPLERLLLPVLTYFERVPLRLPMLVMVIAGYLMLRSYLARRTQLPFIEFWSPLRNALRRESLPSGAPPGPGGGDGSSTQHAR